MTIKLSRIDKGSSVSIMLLVFKTYNPLGNFQKFNDTAYLRNVTKITI